MPAPDVASGRFIAGSYADAVGRRAYKLYVPRLAPASIRCRCRCRWS
ncbi:MULTISPECIES: hypothetical protein [unclassified Variovorax]